MKKTILLLVNLIISVVVMAGSITTQQAEEIARQFVNSQRPAQQGQHLRMAAKRQLPMKVALDANAYYVFNVGSNDGYVMVSGSDLTPQVLGYANKGSFNEEDMPTSMKAWLASYADQIAYIERTMGRNHAPMLRRNRASVAPLLSSTWNQGAPYNNMCPVLSGETSVTGCVATALAQVLNYYKYPAQTIAPIPAYTTETYHISRPEIAVTTIDWNNMLDSYRSGATTVQKNAVATLMKLCGQAVEMDYCKRADGGSGANMAKDVVALRKYFGYDETARDLNRNAFSTNTWENLIYNEIANNRPVLYGGQSTGGGHAFVVDGYDGNGMFHINWGWGGEDDNYFLLSVLNPYNNESIGSSSSEDGFSFGQDAVVGIQHGTGEKIAERFSIFSITNKGNKSYSRTSASADFNGMSVAIEGYNMTGDAHQFYIGLALFQANGDPVSLLKYISAGELEYLSGYSTLTFSSLSFGANLADGDYNIIPVSFSENSESWEPCWGSNVYRIKATFNGNTLTLTEPSISLSGTVTAVGSAAVNTTVKLQAQITNSGSYFNDYVYLFIGNTMVGGRMFEAGAGETATFNIDFLPTTTGTKQLQLAYREGNSYVPFATGTATITEEGEVPLLTGSITITNANSQGNVEETTAQVSAVFQNTGGGSFSNGYVLVDLYQYDTANSKWSYKTSKSQQATIAAGSSTTFTTSFTDLEVGGKYALILSSTLDGGSTYTDIEESTVTFNVVEPSAATPVLTGAVTLTNANSSGDLEETTAHMTANITNTGTAALDHKPVTVDLYKYNTESSKWEFKNYKGYYMDIAAGASDEFSVEFTDLEAGGRYTAQLSYTLDGSNWLTIEGSAVSFNVTEAAVNKDCKLEITPTFQDMENNVLGVNKLKATVAITNSSNIDYSNTFQMNMYDGDLNYLYTISKNLTLAAGQSTTLTLESNELENGKSYAVAFWYQQNAESDTWTYNSTVYKFTVSLPEKNVTLTADNKSREYGDENPTLTYTKTGEGTLSGTPVLSCQANKTSAVGEYEISIEKGSVTNTNLTLVNGKLTITKAPLTITANSFEIKQGDALPEFTVAYAGFKNGETSSVLSKQPVLTCQATSSDIPGVYDISVNGAEAKNYNISYVNGILTVLPNTAIVGIYTDKRPFNVYTVTGYEIRHQVTSLKGLPAGIYIISGQKVGVK